MLHVIDVIGVRYAIAVIYVSGVIGGIGVIGVIVD